MRSVGRVSKIEARCTPKKHSSPTVADTATALAVVTVTALAASSSSSHGKRDARRSEVTAARGNRIGAHVCGRAATVIC